MLKTTRLNILLVEDEDVDALTAARALKDGNINNSFYVANDANIALAMLRGETGKQSIIPLDRRIVLLDLNLSGMNGLDFLKEVRADPQIKATPIIVLSMSNRERDLIEAYHLNIAGYIIKPKKLEEFVELLSIVNQYWVSCEI
jgi:CheY-like chemotaxis protein